jgi:hypothetical protein
MRLIDTTTRKLETFHADIPSYAILSHTWGNEEVSLREYELDAPESRDKLGYKKIAQACLKANQDGHQYIWIDTCCINIDSSSEHFEAINSMFDWYRQSVICYALLEDVLEVSTISTARWFTRGWTLQELLAPRKILFSIKIGRKLVPKDLFVALSAP